MPCTSTARPARRIPVSLRLPPRVVAAVELYAEKHAISKTDAYLELIEKGLEAVGTVDDIAADIRMRLDEMLELLRASHELQAQIDVQGEASDNDRGGD